VIPYSNPFVSYAIHLHWLKYSCGYSTTFERGCSVIPPFPSKSDRIRGILNIEIQSLLVLRMEQIIRDFAPFSLVACTASTERTSFRRQWKWNSIFTHSLRILNPDTHTVWRLLNILHSIGSLIGRIILWIINWLRIA
jgi:hypothetical protein